MIRKLLYLCPNCFAEDSLIHDTTTVNCKSCGSKYPFDGKRIKLFSESLSLHKWYDHIRETLKLFPEQDLRRSGKAILRQGNSEIEFTGFGQRKSILECPQKIADGYLEITADKARFIGDGQVITVLPADITGFSTNSRYFEFKLRHRPFYQIFFEHESPLKYQDLFVKWVEFVHGKKLLEHQPRIRFERSRNIDSNFDASPAIIPFRKEKFGKTEKLLHWTVGTPIVTYLKLNGGVELTGGDHIPESGPFLLVANHQSYLDPMILSVILRRRIGFFTKSTSFCDRRLQPIFRAYRSLPNRRYQTDPQVIRHALWMLKNGHGVGIFPEGERCWDGRLLPLRRNSVRLIASVRVPIVIARISGAYDVLPRWSKSIRRGKIKVEILPPVKSGDVAQTADELDVWLRLQFSKAYSL